MTADPPRGSRIMLGDLGPFTEAGMRRLASERGATVVGAVGLRGAIPREAARLQPDLVVLSLDAEDSRLLASRVRAAVPRARLVLWAGEEDVVEMQEGGSRVWRRVVTAAADALAGALRRQARRSPNERERCPTT